MMSMQSSDVVECGTSASEASGNVSSADTSTWSTYLPRIFQEGSRGFVESDPSNSLGNRAYLDG